MKVKMLTLMAGPDGTFQPGQEIDVSAKQGKALIDGKFAERVERPKTKAKPETATDPEAETRETATG